MAQVVVCVWFIFVIWLGDKMCLNEGSFLAEKGEAHALKVPNVLGTIVGKPKTPVYVLEKRHPTMGQMEGK